MQTESTTKRDYESECSSLKREIETLNNRLTFAEEDRQRFMGDIRAIERERDNLRAYIDGFKCAMELLGVVKPEQTLI